MDLCWHLYMFSRIFHTCYMGTENSSKDTRDRARMLAEVIGRYLQFRKRAWRDVLLGARHTYGTINYVFSYHTDLNMDTVVQAVHALFSFITGKTPRFRVHGGSNTENLALQNIQVCKRLSINHCINDSMTPLETGCWPLSLYSGPIEDGVILSLRTASSVGSRQDYTRAACAWKCKCRWKVHNLNCH